LHEQNELKKKDEPLEFSDEEVNLYYDLFLKDTKKHKNRMNKKLTSKQKCKRKLESLLNQ